MLAVRQQTAIARLLALTCGLLALSRGVAAQPVAGGADWVEAACTAPTLAVTSPIERQADNLVKLIMKSAPVFEAVWPVVTDRKNESAFAHHCANGRKLVVFGADYLQRLRNTERGTGPYWAWVFVAAHEIGHVWRNHGNIRLPCASAPPNATYCPCTTGMPVEHRTFNHALELEADYFAGFVLGKLGASQKEATSAMHALETHASCTHPARPPRAEAVTRGWSQATGTNEASKGMRGTAEDLAKFHLVENRDIYGGDIRELFGISIEACARQCLDNESCAIYSFDRWYNACFIKSRSKIAERFKLTGFPGSRRLNRHDQILKREPKSTIGIRKDLMDDVPGDDTRGRVTLVVRRGHAFYDQVMRTVEANDYADCSAECRAEGERCTAFNFFERTCEMFDHTDGPHPAPDRLIGYFWTQHE